MRPTGTELLTLKAIEELVGADHIAVSGRTGASPAYSQYLLRDLAKYDYVQKMGRIYRLAPQGRIFLQEKRELEEQVSRLQQGIEREWFEDGLGKMVITQLVADKLKLRAIAEVVAQSEIATREDLKAHLAEVVQRDWDKEVEALLPPEMAEALKIESEEGPPEGGLGWVVITQTIENRLKVRAMAELIVQKGIVGGEELRAHLAGVVKRDWDEEIEKLLSQEPAEELE